MEHLDKAVACAANLQFYQRPFLRHLCQTLLVPLLNPRVLHVAGPHHQVIQLLSCIHEGVREFLWARRKVWQAEWCSWRELAQLHVEVRILEEKA